MKITLGAFVICKILSVDPQTGGEVLSQQDVYGKVHKILPQNQPLRTEEGISLKERHILLIDSNNKYNVNSMRLDRISVDSQACILADEKGKIVKEKNENDIDNDMELKYKADKRQIIRKDDYVEEIIEYIPVTKKDLIELGYSEQQIKEVEGDSDNKLNKQYQKLKNLELKKKEEERQKRIVEESQRILKSLEDEDPKEMKAKKLPKVKENDKVVKTVKEKKIKDEDVVSSFGKKIEPSKNKVEKIKKEPVKKENFVPDSKIVKKEKSAGINKEDKKQLARVEKEIEKKAVEKKQEEILPKKKKVKKDESLLKGAIKLIFGGE